MTLLPGILSALAAAVAWGSADFSGGLASRRHSAYQALALSAISGVGLLAVLALLWREALPTPASLGWAALAGLAGALGLATLYRGLAQAQAAVVAPTSAVLGAALPVVVGLLAGRWPGPVRFVGFALALTGLWLISTPPASASGVAPTAGRARWSTPGLAVGVLAGVAFGGFFVLIGQVEPGTMFVPLVLARLTMLAVSLVALARERRPLPALSHNPAALLAGVFDATGNTLYLLAIRWVPLEVAVVLGSLYPVVTVVLARFYRHEAISRTQWIGGTACVAAVMLISG